jgi:hypothetical protein
MKEVNLPKSHIQKPAIRLIKVVICIFNPG